MPMVNEREFEGKDLEEALHTAAEALGIDEPELDYKIIEQGRRGLFGVGARSVRILPRNCCSAVTDLRRSSTLTSSVGSRAR